MGETMATDESEPVDAELGSQIAALDYGLDGIEKSLAPFFARPLKDAVAELPPLEAAKLHVVGAFAINTLFYIYLKTQGVSPADHPVKDEMERVKGYFKKI